MPNSLFWTQINRAFSIDGAPVPGALAYFYQNGTSTQVSVYQDPECTSEFSQPVVSDGEGTFPPVYLSSFGPFRVRMTDADDVTLPGYPRDDLVPLSADQNYARSVQFSPSEEVPESNVQDAIDHVAGNVGSQLELQQRSLTPWTTGGTGNDYTITPSPAITAYGTWQSFQVRFSRGNAGAATLNVNGLGSRAIYKPVPAGGNSPLVEGDIARGAIRAVYYNGSQFVLLNGGLTDLRDGTAASPAIGYASSPGTGLYLTGGGAHGWSIGGVSKMTLGQDFRLESGSFLASEADSPNSPGYSWGGYSTTGLFLKSTRDGIGVSIGGTEKAVIDTDFTLKEGSIQVPAGGSGGSCNYTFTGKTGNGLHYFTTDDSVNLMRASSSRVKVTDDYTAIRPNGSDEIARVTTTALCVGATTTIDPASIADYGFSASAIGAVKISRNGAVPLEVRRSNGGVMLNWWRGTTNVAAITEDGSGTITYGTFCGAHWSQGPALLPGTIVETTDELAEWPGDEFPSILPKYQAAGAGSRSVYGVFSHLDDDGDPLIAALGAYKIRMAPGQAPKRGDLVKSGDDGLGVVQRGETFRVSTVGKVTSATVIETYPDGSFLVPCTLHCG